ncbi:hypothetical protein Q4574_12170 [Aliiglaciecola sp. 3_MG-2023]|uniref:hypothetical protein n=1 Tax=Aliiglaciecola sp. 3_MG-2023 TaxID=3062644 RepID=UPI0026E3EDB7|nr:hypothetical protein [Aliiglaciecola sp. 3_MG-2023]MDO6694042.1 hypothetical protein [Aliiglaciecola sp. 3_MG-2023]
MVKNRISLNTQNKVTAQNMAAIGNVQLLSQISRQPQEKITTQTINIEGQGEYTIDTQSTQTKRFNGHMRVIEINSTGTSEDKLASVNLTQFVISYPLLRALPKAPLIVRKSLAIDNTLTLVANPNGAGEGLPLSLWTGNTVDTTTLGLLTCQLYEYLNDYCELSPLSGKANKSADIIDNPDAFPNDIFAYLTNLPEKNRAQLLDDADSVISHCESLNHISHGLVWVKGNCELTKDTSVGTTANPVMLVIDEGSLTFSENSKITGLVIMLMPFDSIIAAKINVNGPAAIEGALIASESVAFHKLPLTIKYDTEIINNFLQNPGNWRVARVPNSWRNF